MSMGGGASGGGQSGTIDYPDYMKTWHMTMLNDVYTLVKGAYDPPTSFLYDPKVWFGMPSNEGAYTVMRAFGALDVKSILHSILQGEGDYSYILNESALSDLKTKAATLRGLLTTTPEAATNDLIDAYSDKLLQRVNSDVIPKVEIGMRDANAVIGTSFVIAKEIAMEHYTAEVSEFAAKVKVRFWELLYDIYKYLEQQWIAGSTALIELGLKQVAQVMEHKKAHAVIVAELANAAVLAQSKYGVVRTEDEIRKKTWKLDLYDHMNKTLASISGASPVRQGTTAGQSLFSGSVGMAAMGAGVGAYLATGTQFAALGATGGPAGAIVGGAIGLGVGLLGGLFGK